MGDKREGKTKSIQIQRGHNYQPKTIISFEHPEIKG